MLPTPEQSKAFDILLCQSKYEEVKEECIIEMHLTSDEERNILVNGMFKKLGDRINSVLKGGSSPDESIDNLINSLKLTLDGLSSLLKLIKMLNTLDIKFNHFDQKLNYGILTIEDAKSLLESAKKQVDALDSWTVWIEELCFINKICSSMKLRSAKKKLQGVNVFLSTFKALGMQPNLSVGDVDFSAAEHHFQNVAKKLEGEAGIIGDLKLKLENVKENFWKIKNLLKEVQNTEIQYIDVMSQYRDAKENIVSWRFIILPFLVGCLVFGVGLHNSMSVKTGIDSVTVKPLPATPQSPNDTGVSSPKEYKRCEPISAQVALVPHDQNGRKKDTVLFLNNMESVSFSSVQHVKNVKLEKDGFEIIFPGYYWLYFSIHIKLAKNQTCSDFGHKFKFHLLRRNKKDLSINNMFCTTIQMCYDSNTDFEQTVTGECRIQLQVDDFVQLVSESNKSPIYFTERSSFFGLEKDEIFFFNVRIKSLNLEHWNCG